jgi:large subunit ribosomal protein L10
MTKAEKTVAIQTLTDKIASSKYFYITDCSSLPVKKVNALRRQCFEQGVQMQVVKNKVIKTALKWASEKTSQQYDELNEALHGASAIMFCETGNVPAKLIKEFRGVDGKKPLLKAAYIDSGIFVGDDSLDALTKIKSKKELLGEIVGLLQSPMQKLVSALQSGGNTIGGLLKTLEEREEA